MKWVDKHKLLAIKALQYNGHPCIEINNLWQALHQTFNAAQNNQINMNILDEIPSKPPSTWPSFSNEEFTSAIDKYSNLSAPGPDRVS